MVIKVKAIEMSHTKSEFMKEKRAHERVLESSSIQNSIGEELVEKSVSSQNPRAECFITEEILGCTKFPWEVISDQDQTIAFSLFIHLSIHSRTVLSDCFILSSDQHLFCTYCAPKTVLSPQNMVADKRVMVLLGHTNNKQVCE